MIMGGDRKKLASIIVARVKPSNIEDMKANNQEGLKARAEGMKSEGEKEDGVKYACEEIIGAIESKDADALAQALGSFIEMYKPSEDESEEE